FLPEGPGVLGMREKSQNKHDASIVMDGDNQSVLVSASIEDGDNLSTGHLRGIGMRKLNADFLNARPSSRFSHLDPFSQRQLRIGVLAPKTPDRRFLDNPHEYIMYSGGGVCQMGHTLNRKCVMSPSFMT